MLTGHGDPLAGLDPASLFAPVADETIIGLAVSGGADSLALLVLAAAWRDQKAAPRIVVYTVDHRLRPEAEVEAAMVARVAASLGFDCRVLRWDAPKPATGRQAAAREARYRLMAEAMSSEGASVLLTGHHRRDQAETLLMRMAHGSGVSGLGGMRSMAEAFGITVFRPLLDIAPETLLTLVARAGLVPAADPGNGDTHYERVRWRSALETLAPLGLTDERLAQLAHRMQRIDALAEAETDSFVSAYAEIDFLGIVRIEREHLRSAQPEIAIRSLTRAIAAASGQSSRALAQIETLYAELLASPRVALTLSGARIEARGGVIIFYREAGRMPPVDRPLAAGQPVDFDGRFSITADGPAILAVPRWTRAAYEARFDAPLDAPVAALKTAPLVTDAAGQVLSLGTKVFSPFVTVAGPALTDRS